MHGLYQKRVKSEITKNVHLKSFFKTEKKKEIDAICETTLIKPIRLYTCFTWRMITERFTRIEKKKKKKKET